jgi:hypothetical protein
MARSTTTRAPSPWELRKRRQSHSGVMPLRPLAHSIGLIAGLSRALASRRPLVHDRRASARERCSGSHGGASVVSETASGSTAALPVKAGVVPLSPRIRYWVSRLPLVRSSAGLPGSGHRSFW